VLKKDYGKECDLWSLGVITYILLSGIPPFNGTSDSEIMAAIKKGKFNFSNKVWNSVSTDAKEFITALLQIDVSKRLSAEEALKHKWIVEQSKLEVNADSTKDALLHL